MFKGQVPIGNGCGPWTGHTNSTNISWHLTPSSLPLFISSHLIAFHPHLISPPVTDHERVVPVFAGEQERWSGCVCLCVNRNMNVITPPHPTPAVTDQPRGLVCLCVHRNMNVISPPRPTGNWSAKSSACVCRTARKMIRLLCLCVNRNMNVITHPTPPHPQKGACVCWREERW